MARTKRVEREPRFLGAVPCSGPNAERAKAYIDKAKAYKMLGIFHQLEREDQLQIAALSEEMTKDRGPYISPFSD